MYKFEYQLRADVNGIMEAVCSILANPQLSVSGVWCFPCVYHSLAQPCGTINALKVEFITDGSADYVRDIMQMQFGNIILRQCSYKVQT